MRNQQKFHCSDNYANHRLRLQYGIEEFEFQKAAFSQRCEHIGGEALCDNV